MFLTGAAARSIPRQAFKATRSVRAHLSAPLYCPVRPCIAALGERVPNIAAVLKTEISRIARKEIKGDVLSLKRAAANHRHEIAALKKRIEQLEGQLRRVVKSRAPAPQDSEATDVGTQLRFSATRFAAQRRKLGLSAADFAKLLGVSSLSVYKWESGKTRPRRAQLEAIAAARGLGKREAAARLEKLAA